MIEPDVRPPVLENRRFGRYTIRLRLAHGGMASVYLAQLRGAEGFSKWVAIKIIHPHLADDRTLAQMFLNEARLTARLHHPNICNVFDFGEQDGTYFLAMEYLEGEALSSVLRACNGAVSYPMAARIAVDVASALDFAHELRAADGKLAGVVHRDVSPQNIFVLYGGTVKLVDFGIARTDEYVAERTETGSLRGKLAYMSPEQVHRKKLDRRTDVFALGAVLWEMTVGRRLFRRDSEGDTLTAVMTDPIPTPSAFVQGYPAVLEAVVMRALARDPAGRYATASEMARDLNDCLRALGGAPTSLEMADVMTGMFGEKMEQRRELLRAIASEGGHSNAPSTNADDPAELPTRPSEVASGDAQAAAMPRTTSDRIERPEPLLHFGPRRRTRIALWGGASACLLAAGAAWILVGEPSRNVSLVARGVVSSVNHPTLAVVAAATAASAETRPASSPATIVANGVDSGVPAAPGSRTPGVRPAPRSSRARRLPSDATPRAAHVDSPAALGTLDLAAIPSAAVYDHGRSLGYTPLRGRSLPAGRHALQLVPTNGLPSRTVVVEIRAGQTTSTSVRFP